MSDTRVEPCVDDKEYMTEKITISNIPDIGDKTGETFLKNMEEGIMNCRKFIARGFRLTDFWTNPNTGVEFVLKKKKVPGESCELDAK